MNIIPLTIVEHIRSEPLRDVALIAAAAGEPWQAFDVDVGGSAAIVVFAGGRAIVSVRDGARFDFELARTTDIVGDVRTALERVGVDLPPRKAPYALGWPARSSPRQTDDDLRRPVAKAQAQQRAACRERHAALVRATADYSMAELATLLAARLALGGHEAHAAAVLAAMQMDAATLAKALGAAGLGFDRDADGRITLKQTRETKATKPMKPTKRGGFFSEKSR